MLFRGATFLKGILDPVATGRVVAYISNPIILMKLGMRGEGITGTESLGVHWYALNTKAKHEGLVAQQFERIVIECFFSLLDELRVIYYQSKVVITPLFPGYLFARANLMEHYRALAYTRGVRELVTFGSSHAVVDSIIIDGTKNRISKAKDYFY